MAGFRFTAFLWDQLVPAVTDAQGHYTVTAVKDDVFTVLLTGRRRISRPVSSRALTSFAKDTQIDIDVIADATLAGSGVPASYPRPTTSFP